MMATSTTTAYARPCDHCQGTILARDLGPRSFPRRAWACITCGCMWTLGWTILEKGYNCPVHGDLPTKGA